MAESLQQALTQNAAAAPSRPVEGAEGSTAGKSKKMFLILSIIVVQIIGAYFLVGFLFRHGSPDPQAANKSPKQNQSVQYQRGNVSDPNFDHVYVVKDLVVNPAGTNGLRFLLATIGLEVTSEETVKELEKRDVQIHDSIIGILTSKTLPELDDTGSRDSLKIRIKQEIDKDITSGKVINVYFSKFIIQ